MYIHVVFKVICNFIKQSCLLIDPTLTVKSKTFGQNLKKKFCPKGKNLKIKKNKIEEGVTGMVPH